MAALRERQEKERRQIENERLQAEQKAAEERKVFSQKLSQMEEENKRLQAEYRRPKKVIGTRSPEEVIGTRSPEEVIGTNGKIFTGIKYRIACSTGAVLDARDGKVGPNYTIITTVELSNNVYDEYSIQRTWTIVSVNGGYRIKTCSTGAILDTCGGKVGPNQSVTTFVGLQEDIYNVYDINRTWNIVSVNGGYRIKTCSTSAVLDDCGGKVGSYVGLQDDVYNTYDKHRTWTFIPV